MYVLVCLRNSRESSVTYLFIAQLLNVILTLTISFHFFFYRFVGVCEGAGRVRDALSTWCVCEGAIVGLWSGWREEQGLESYKDVGGEGGVRM